MRFLTGILTLLLLPSLAAAATPLDRLIGSWSGTVEATNDCTWKVTGKAAAVKGGVAGDLSYSGKCAKEKRAGTFTARMKSKNCFSAEVLIAGMEPIKMKGCAGKGRTINFETAGFNGTFAFSPRGSVAKLSVSAGMGAATGKLTKAAPKKKPQQQAPRQPQEEDGGGVGVISGDDEPVYATDGGGD